MKSSILFAVILVASGINCERAVPSFLELIGTHGKY